MAFVGVERDSLGPSVVPLFFSRFFLFIIWEMLGNAPARAWGVGGIGWLGGAVLPTLSSVLSYLWVDGAKPGLLFLSCVFLRVCMCVCRFSNPSNLLCFFTSSVSL